MSELDDFNQGVIKEFRANQGKVSGQMAGMPVLLLTTTGAKTGRSLTRPLVYTRDGDRIVIIASFAGNPHNPPWYHNLVKNPTATVELGADKFQVRAAVTSGEERQRLFDRQAEQMAIFKDYQKKTSRQIPVLTLTRIN
jgi:deazaflavin-dependent oxidoreductase (nitroreductase family)